MYMCAVTALFFLGLKLMGFMQIVNVTLQMDIERFLSENLNEHRKGILGKTVPVSSMLIWTRVCVAVISCVCVN